MKPITTLSVAALLLAVSAVQAQTPTVKPDKPATEVNHSEITSDQIILVKDAKLPPAGERTATSSLQQQYGSAKAEESVGPDNNPLDINKIRVITPEQFATLAPDAQKAIENDPYYVVSDKSRKEVMAEFIRKYHGTDQPGSTGVEAAPAMAAPAKPE